MNLPEWTGATWQWVLLIGACGGLSIIVLMFALALMSKCGAPRDCLTCSLSRRSQLQSNIVCTLNDPPDVNDVLAGKVNCEYWQ
jgi:hypothetical protein